MNNKVEVSKLETWRYAQIGLQTFNGRMSVPTLVDWGYEPEDLVEPCLCQLRATHIIQSNFFSGYNYKQVRQVYESCWRVEEDLAVCAETIKVLGLKRRVNSEVLMGNAETKWPEVIKTVARGGLIIAGVMEYGWDGHIEDGWEHVVSICGCNESSGRIAVLDSSLRGNGVWEGFGGYSIAWEDFCKINRWSVDVTMVDATTGMVTAMGGWQEHLMISVTLRK